MAHSEFTCPHCKGLIKTLPLASRAEQTAPYIEFSSTANTPSAQEPEPAGFWNSDGITSVITGLFAGGLVWLYVWAYGYSPAWAVATGLVAGVGLAVFKILLYAPARPPKPEPQTKLIQAELTVNGKSRFIAVFELEEHQLLHVAQRIIKEGKPFSRRALCKPGTLSQLEYDKLRDEMAGRGWVDYEPENPNAGARINRAGLSVLRAILKDLSPPLS